MNSKEEVLKWKSKLRKKRMFQCKCKKLKIIKQKTKYKN